jgi:hypothetical protein
VKSDADPLNDDAHLHDLNQYSKSQGSKKLEADTADA